MHLVAVNAETHNHGEHTTVLGPERDSCISPSSPQGASLKREQKERNDQRTGRLCSKKAVFRTWRAHCTHNLTTVMVDCIRLGLSTFHLYGGGAQEIPLLPEALLVANTC